MRYDDIPLELLMMQLEALKYKKREVYAASSIELVLPQDAPPRPGPFPSAPPNKRVVIFDI